MRVLVVDDEELARSSLVRKIGVVSPEAKIESVGDPHAALEKILQNPPDVLFLDIKMPGLTGFELLANVPPEKRMFHLIFCTAYAEHAVEAFTEAAVDYLLKPVEPERLAQAWARLGPPNWQAPPLAKLLVKTRNGRRIVPLDEVLFFSSESHETVAYLKDGSEVIVDLTLTELESQQMSQAFFRVHRSFLVALQHVESLDEACQPAVLLPGGRRVPVARRRKAALVAALAQSA